MVVFVPISQDLLAKKGEAGKAIIKLEEQLAEFKQQEKKAVEEMKGPGKGRPKSLAFEHQVRTILASGCSARAAQDHVLSSARVYLTSAAFAEYEQHVPTKRWSYPSTPDPNPTSAPKQYFYPSSSQHRFQYQREALGNEAWLYSMVELARAKEVLQWGFDETSIDGTPTLNQWVLVPNGVLAPRIITIQCAGNPNPDLFCPHTLPRHSPTAHTNQDCLLAARLWKSANTWRRHGQLGSARSICYERN